MTSKLDALVARIRADVEIRRTKSGKATVETAKTREKREARERGSNDPALSALMKSSNGLVFHAKPDPYRYFHEVGRTAVLQKQICRCCDNVQVNVVSEMIHLRGRRDADSPTVDVWIRRSSVQPLPHEEPIWAPAHAVEFCGDCIQTAMSTDCWSKAQVIPESNGQLPLIH
jgi:hypothetical protein